MHVLDHWMGPNAISGSELVTPAMGEMAGQRRPRQRLIGFSGFFGLLNVHRGDYLPRSKFRGWRRDGRPSWRFRLLLVLPRRSDEKDTTNFGILPRGTTSLAGAHGNRTHQEPVSRPLTGFEDRAGHQPRTRSRVMRSKDLRSILTNGKTVRVLFGEFSEWMRSQRSERTLEERQRHLRRWCERFGDLPCTAIGASNLESFINDLLLRYPS